MQKSSEPGAGGDCGQVACDGVGGFMPIKDVLRRRGEMQKLRAKAAQMQEWFESAMVMVDNVPVGVAWSDPQQGFVVTYVNSVGRTMIGPAVGGTESIVGQPLFAIFPTLAASRDIL